VLHWGPRDNDLPEGDRDPCPAAEATYLEAQRRNARDLASVITAARWARDRSPRRAAAVTRLLPLPRRIIAQPLAMAWTQWKQSQIEEMLNPVPGIDDDPDDEVPWAANLAFPDLMDLARTIRRKGDLKTTGWRGPIGLGAGNERTLLHNVRFWWWPMSPAPTQQYDRSLARWKKTVLLFHAGEMRVLLRDAPMSAEEARARGRYTGG
ncbi:Gbp1, partial [Symbiodinium sp. CCMP2456]